MKKICAIMIGSLLIAVLPAGSLQAQTVTISIQKIDANEYVSGAVGGLKPSDYATYKVVVYVHTDKWYIHPFAAQGEGQSWAAIQKDGTWKIRTVRREFVADKMVALLVKRNYPEPNRIEDEALDRVQYLAIAIRPLAGTPDHGKL